MDMVKKKAEEVRQLKAESDHLKKISSKVSMVVPCYNKIDYIDEMLQSIYDQDYDHIELVLVNDGSTDGTEERIAIWEPKFISRGYEVIVIHQDNQGVGLAIKNGLLQVSGDYVCFPDCDDELRVNFVSRMASILDDNLSINWVQCNLSLWLSNDEKYDDYLQLLLFDSSQWSIWRKMIRVQYFNQCKVIEGYVEDRLSQEMSVNIPLALGGSFPYFINETLYNYKVRKNSIMETARSKDIESYFCKYRDLTISILEHLGALDEKSNLITRIGIEKIIVTETDKTDIELRRLILLYLKNCRGIDVSNLQDLEIAVLLFAFEVLAFFNDIFEPKELSELLCIKERIVLCACLGSYGLRLLPVFKFLGMNQLICWDEAGGENVSQSGYDINKPNYSSLNENDLVLILSTRDTVIKHISSQASGATIVTLEKIKQYLGWKIRKIGG